MVLVYTIIDSARSPLTLYPLLLPPRGFVGFFRIAQFLPLPRGRNTIARRVRRSSYYRCSCATCPVAPPCRCCCHLPLRWLRCHITPQPGTTRFPARTGFPFYLRKLDDPRPTDGLTTVEHLAVMPKRFHPDPYVPCPSPCRRLLVSGSLRLTLAERVVYCVWVITGTPHTVPFSPCWFSLPMPAVCSVLVLPYLIPSASLRSGRLAGSANHAY